MEKDKEKIIEKYMRIAIEEAKLAKEKGENPFGAVLLDKEYNFCHKAHSRSIELSDPTAHAEMIAIREAAKTLGGWRLLGCSMYVTCEPCSMCAGAMVWARLEKVYIGTMDPKAGACGSIFNIPGEQRLNHQIEIETGIMQEECSRIMKDFFKKLRTKKSEERTL